MSPVILHLTDLHFGWSSTEDELARRRRCLNSLVTALQQLAQKEPAWKPTLVVISGDIGWKGVDADYAQAHEWLSQLLQTIEVAPDNVVVCPGNHDINRLATRGIAVPQDALEADDSLRPPVPPLYIEPFKAFTNYCRNTAKFRAWRFNNEDSWLVGATELQGLKLLALNTSWYCRGDSDRGKLWVGQPQLDLLIDGLPTVARQTSDNPPVVAICHHPFPWWQEADLHEYPRSDGSGQRPSSEELLVTRSNLILTGHTHSSFRQPNHLRMSAYHLNGGASYAGSGWLNSVRLIRISAEGFEHQTLNFDPGDTEEGWTTLPPSRFIRFRETAGETPGLLRAQTHPHAILHYLRRLAEDTRGIQLLGMGRSFQVDLPIDDVYIPLRMVRFTRQRSEDEPERLPKGNGNGPAASKELDPAESEMTVEQDLAEKGPEWMFQQCQQQAKRGVVVLGEPGAGKTTWARQLAWRLASGSATPEALGLPPGLRPVL
ncbi:MAG: metallophosphoesterase, partial [Planctomycetota bacterium]